MSTFKNTGEKNLDYWIYRIETMARRMEKEVEVTRKRAEDMEQRAKVQEKMVEDMRVIQTNLLEGKQDYSFKLQNEAYQLVEREKYHLGVSYRKLHKEHLKLQKELEELREKNNVRVAEVSGAEEVALARAKTFAIVDSILFSIENWATDDSPAPDFTLASQATLFPVWLSKVSQNESAYYLTEVPPSADEVVKRGRELVQFLREKEHVSVLDPTGWSILHPIVHSWWTRDAMPLLHGEGLEEWEFEEPHTREEILRWRDLEAARALEFPLIFDGFELVKKYGDEIREETGLPEFSRRTQQTRIQAHD